MSGSALVLPGLQLDGPSLAETIRTCGVTVANGVPTIWQNVCSHLATTGHNILPLQRVIIAGSAPSPKLIETLENRHDVEVCHLWGMTEMSPVGTVGAPALQYLNRLSDFLFVASRSANNNGAGDVLWVPGQNR